MNETLTICGSMDFINEMESMADELEQKGYRVFVPDRGESKPDLHTLSGHALLQQKKSFIDQHMGKIKESSMILVANYEKNLTSGYIGSNTLIEIAFGYLLEIPIALLHPAGDQNCRLEVECMATGNLHGSLENLKIMDGIL